MTKKSQNITNALYPLTFLALLLLIWELICRFELVPGFLLPSPERVVSALITDAPILWEHAGVTLTEAFLGLFFSILIAVSLAVAMDAWQFLYRALYPVLVITQTIPTIAVAPLFVLWMGYGMTPKIVVIVIACFFPLCVSVFGGLQATDTDILRMYRSMGATRRQILCQVKLPGAIESFFSGLKVAAAYAVVGGVISEWLGGTAGLGVYMTRVRKSYAFEKMFAVILIISIISLLLMWLVGFIQKKAMPWKAVKQEGKE